MNEYAYEAALVAASPRVRMVELGRTNPIPSGSGAPGNRPINMLIIGGTADLTPLPTAAAISSSPAIAFNCNVHGDEPHAVRTGHIDGAYEDDFCPAIAGGFGNGVAHLSG